MKHGWVLEYKTAFYSGQERLIIQRYYRIGPLHLLHSGIWLYSEEASRIAEFVRERDRTRPQQ